MTSNPIRDAVMAAAEIAGSQTKLAGLIGSTPQEVNGWTQEDVTSARWRPVPPAKAVAIERETGISRMRLRFDAADIWPEAAAAAMSERGPDSENVHTLGLDSVERRG